MIYLMSPYSNPDPEVREFNYEMAKAAVLLFTVRGVTVYSPIVHSHPIADTYGVARDHEFWGMQNKEMMDISESAVILTSEGWATSAGIQAEITYYSALGKGINFLEPTSMLLELQQSDFSLPLIIASRFLQPSSVPVQESDR